LFIAHTAVTSESAQQAPVYLCAYRK